MAKHTKKSPAKEQSLRDYSGMITVYAIIVTIILIIMILKYWLGIDVIKGAQGLIGQAETSV